MRPAHELKCRPGPGGLTGKGDADVVVEHGDFTDGSRILQLQGRLLLHAEDDDF